MEEKVIDLDEVLERVQDDKELLLELFEIFSQDYSQKIQKLKTAIAEKNFEMIKDLIHSIKGAAGNISAKAIHATCMIIEHLARDENLPAIQTSLPVLEGHFQNLEKRMAEIKSQFGGPVKS